MNDLRQDCACQNVGLADATRSDLEIGERRQADTPVLAPVGRIDNLTSAEFRTRLLGALSSCSADVVIDFSRVEYISICGLRALMTASRQKSKERRLAVACLNAVVHEIFTISRLSRHVPIFATVEEASAALEMPAAPRPAERRAGLRRDTDAPLRLRFWGTRGSLPRRCESLRSVARSGCAARGARPFTRHIAEYRCLYG